MDGGKKNKQGYGSVFLLTYDNKNVILVISKESEISTNDIYN